MGYAVVLGEALIDLLETTRDGETIYRQAIGGAPLNVAVGATRLGGDVRFVGSLSSDILGDRIAGFLRATGVGTAGVKRVPAPTTLAVTTFEGAEPSFTFYGEPPSYALLTPQDVDRELVAGAALLYAGSISLLREPFRAAAAAAWAVQGQTVQGQTVQGQTGQGQTGQGQTGQGPTEQGPIKVFDPNVRPKLLPDAAAVTALRDLVEGFFATADLVKLSSADAEALYQGATPAAAAEQIHKTGARAVVVTCGAQGAYVSAAGGTVLMAAPAVAAIDATGAGDSVMAALVSRLLAEGLPADLAGWQRHVSFALAVAGLVCERPGGAVAMPTAAEFTDRWS